MSDDQWQIGEISDRWEAEYQKRAALIQALEALCAAWAQENRDVTQFHLPAAPSMNAIAHMTERRKCESALKDIIREHKGER